MQPVNQACAAGPLVLGCSPRFGGNSDTLARLVYSCLREQGFAASLSFVAEHVVAPCVGCSACESVLAQLPSIPEPAISVALSVVPSAAPSAAQQLTPLPDSEHLATQQQSGSASFGEVCRLLPKHCGCPLGATDDSWALLHPLIEATSLFVVAPIYMYHLPAQAKALLDRLQPFWFFSRTHPARVKNIPARPVFPILLAGRSKGEQLFSGTLLSLKFALAPLGFAMQKPLLLRGLDGIGAFTGDKDAQADVMAYTRAAGHSHPHFS